MPSADYQLRKESGLCTRCGVGAADDSQFCVDHRDAQRGYNLKYKRKVSRRRRRLKLCRYCDQPRRAGDTSCMRCRVARNRLSLIAPPESEIAVEKAERIAAATRVHGDGRERYHGQQKRGNQPHLQLDEQDLGFARAALVAGETGLRLLEGDEVKSMPRIQRDDVKSAALHQLARAQGHIEDVLERRGHFKARHGRRDGE